MPQAEVLPEREPSIKLETFLAILRKINWARRVGKRDMAEKLLRDLRTLEGKH